MSGEHYHAAKPDTEGLAASILAEHGVYEADKILKAWHRLLGMTR